MERTGDGRPIVYLGHDAQSRPLKWILHECLRSTARDRGNNTDGSRDPIWDEFNAVNGEGGQWSVIRKHFAVRFQNR